MMTKTTVVAAIAFSLTLGAGVALAQSPQPAAAPAAGMDKKAVSKACSDQANAKGLHGEERKKFRAECKHKGGKNNRFMVAWNHR
jgi:hypothetical protein